MKPKGFGKICYILSSLHPSNDLLLKLINYQAKQVSKLSVVVQDDLFPSAPQSFSKKVHLFNASMQLTSQSRKSFLSMLKIIQPDAVFVFEADVHAVAFAEYAKCNAIKIRKGEHCSCSKKELLIGEDIPNTSQFMVDYLEQTYRLDFYPKHYLQSKTLYAQMKPHELLDAALNRGKRVKAAFQKEWGYGLPTDPATYNEKINCCKMLSSYKKYRKFVDKAKVRKYLQKNGYAALLPKCLGHTKRKISQKLWDSLPSKFVIKPTNASGLNIVIDDKSKYNRHLVNRVMGYIKTVNYGLYKNEPVYGFWSDFLITEYIPHITDYKFFCFGGNVAFVAVVRELKRENENGEPYQMIADKDFCELPFSYGYERGTQTYEKPTYYDEMLRTAERLSKHFPHVRVDMMGTADSFYFGEFTFYPGGGRDRFTPSEYDAFYGSMMQ